MRHLLATVLLIAGCAAQGLPLEGGGSGGSGGNGNGVVDMARPRDLGGAGASCQTACDCQPGLACRQGMCGMSGIGQIYCCGEGQCPAGSFCQTATGSFSQCGSPGGGGGGGGGGGFGGGPGGIDLGIRVDGGNGGICQFITCKNDQICKQAGCGSCGAAGTCK